MPAATSGPPRFLLSSCVCTRKKRGSYERISSQGVSLHQSDVRPLCRGAELKNTHHKALSTFHVPPLELQMADAVRGADAGTKTVASNAGTLAREYPTLTSQQHLEVSFLTYATIIPDAPPMSISNPRQCS
eukprot:TRINITY_DN2735_c0_g1_i1.p2 TRINITY_DN2735_c0_g1~~TRINITY_DN2735_c0_g1_i1.p2  ORF type:complete len:131 (-),score=2.69 TRINITY_DN2735_c0_g1_i1:18-410(-)